MTSFMDNKKGQEYHPESYWSDVAQRIEDRGDNNILAGDDEPYYRYKREKFLSLLGQLDFKNKKVLEVGCGPGGNLLVVLQYQPNELQGVDISPNMVKLAKENLKNKNVIIQKIDGVKLPFDDNSFDIVFTATVLQHNTDEKMLLSIMSELCRVSKKQVAIFERVESAIKGDELCLGRPIAYYENKFLGNGYKLRDTSYINIRVSYLMAGMIRKGLNPASRKEGEPLNSASVFLQKMLLPVTKTLDNIFISKRDIAKLVFEK